MAIREEKFLEMGEGDETIACDLKEHFSIAVERWTPDGVPMRRAGRMRGVVDIKRGYQEGSAAPLNCRVESKNLVDGFGKRRGVVDIAPINRAGRERRVDDFAQVEET
jgi:hypothetical protein